MYVLSFYCQSITWFFIDSSPHQREYYRLFLLYSVLSDMARKWGRWGCLCFCLAHGILSEMQYFSFSPLDVVNVIMGNTTNDDQILQIPDLMILLHICVFVTHFPALWSVSSFKLQNLLKSDKWHIFKNRCCLLYLEGFGDGLLLK